MNMKAEKTAGRRPFLRRISTLLCWCVASRPAPPVNGASASVLLEQSTAKIVENEVRVGDLSEVDLATTSFSVEEALASSSMKQTDSTKVTKVICTDHVDPVDESAVELDDELCGAEQSADDDTTHCIRDTPRTTSCNLLDESHSRPNGKVPSIKAIEEISGPPSQPDTAESSSVVYWQLPDNYPTISLVDDVLDDTQTSLGIMEEFWTSLHSRQSLVSSSSVHLYTAVVEPSALENAINS